MLARASGSAASARRDGTDDAQRRALTAEIAAAQAGLPGPHRPAEEVATVIAGLAMAANQEIQLLEDASAPARARTAMRHAAGLST